VPINRPSVVRLFSYQLAGKNNLIVILPFAVGAADLQNPQICSPAEEKHAGSNAKLLFGIGRSIFQNKELTHD
jgi:hypothetical protein